MKRQLFELRRGDCNCCPGHDAYPGEAYNNNRSKAARSRGKKDEHQYVRTILRRTLRKELASDTSDDTI